MPNRRIRVGLVGVGNSTKSLVEGVAHYTRNETDGIGLMHPVLGDYRVSDIDFVAAFDIDQRKVGKRLGDAAVAEPNRTMKIADSLDYPVIVSRGPTYDGVIAATQGKYICESDEPPVDVEKVLRDSGAEILVNYLPTGANAAACAYAEAALAAGCSFINCMPARIARTDEWIERFESAGLVVLGDDIKSQCGATLVNRILLSMFKLRGIRVLESKQTNFGGNADHYNLHYRPQSKEETKETALRSILDSFDCDPVARMVFVEENYGHKRAEIQLRGEIFGHVPVSISVTLDDEDSPNSAGVVVDAIRATRLLTEHGNARGARNVSPFLMKAPHLQIGDFEAASAFYEAVHAGSSR